MARYNLRSGKLRDSINAKAQAADPFFAAFQAPPKPAAARKKAAAKPKPKATPKPKPKAKAKAKPAAKVTKKTAAKKTKKKTTKASKVDKTYKPVTPPDSPQHPYHGSSQRSHHGTSQQSHHHQPHNNPSRGSLFGVSQRAKDFKASGKFETDEKITVSVLAHKYHFNRDELVYITGIEEIIMDWV